MKRHLLLTNMLFNQPLLATPELLDLGVRWANQSLQLNIINIGAAAPAVATPRADYGDDDEGGPPVRSSDSRERTGVAVVPVHGILVSRNAHMRGGSGPMRTELVIDGRTIYDDTKTWSGAVQWSTFLGNVTMNGSSQLDTPIDAATPIEFRRHLRLYMTPAASSFSGPGQVAYKQRSQA